MNKEEVDFVESCTDIAKVREFMQSKSPDSKAFIRAQDRVSHLMHIETQREQRKTNILTILILCLTIILAGLTIALVISEFNIFEERPNQTNTGTENNSPQNTPKPVAKQKP